VDEILGEGDDPDDKAQPPSDPEKPKTDRETELSLREQVQAAVAELNREQAHVKEHADLKAKIPQPPEAEVKPWRHSIWGDK
jgi:hypothetical protein